MPYYITQDSDECEAWAVVKEDGELMACHPTKESAIDQMVAISLSEGIEPGGERDLRADAPAPKKDQIEGSEENEPGSAKGAGGDIVLSDSTKTALRNKVAEHNEEMKEKGKPDYSRTTYGQLAAVYRRGAGAFSTSHRPGMTRAQWAMARVNAYLYLLANGKPKNEKYVTDNDLLPSGHPKSTRSLEQRAVNLEPPAFMRAAARRGLKLYEDGFAGDGLVQRTVDEARAMAAGNVTRDKWVRIAAWIARHMPDLDAPKNSDRNDPDYPGPGLVAHLLWGSGPSKRQATRAMEYAQGVVDRLKAEDKRGNEMAKRETRNFDADFEIREEGDGMTFVGYAAKFNSRSENLGGFVETIQPGAFRKSLRSRNDVKLLVNHDAGRVLASSRAGTLRLKEDSVGLRVEADLPNTTDGRDMAELLRRGDLSSMSFGFSVIKDSWSNDGTERSLESVRLFETSIVAFPAYQATEASVRAYDQLALRTNVDADELADAILKLEEGEDLSDDQARLLKDVVEKLSPVKEEEPKAVEEETNILELKRKQLELILKRV